MSYPFRYYGRSPADWHEGANEGHIYEVQFRTAPSESERAQLAKVYEGVLASGPARPSTRPWLWSQRFARFTVGERWSSAARATFAKVTDFLLAAHRVCPIAEVVFWGMREEGRSGWDRWTVAVQPTPDQGPAYDPPAGVRAVDPALPVGAPDAAFEAARLAARSEVQRTRIQKVNADSDVQLVPFEGEVVRPTLPVELEEAFGSPKPAWVDKNGRKSLADGYHPVFDTPRPIARHTTNGYTDGFAFLTEAFAVQRVVFPEGQRAGHYIAVHRDGDQGLTACRNHLYSVDFETGVATPRFIVEDELRGLAYLGDLWVVRGASALLVLDPSTEVPTVVATAKGKGDSVSVHRDDTVIITAEYGANPRVYAFAEGKLRKVAGFKSKLSSPVEVDGRVLFYASDARAYYALDGLDEAVEAWAAPLREKAEKARQKAAKKAKPKKAKTGKTEPGTTAPGTTEPGNTAPDVATAGPALVPCTLPEAPPSPPPTSDFGEHALAVGRFALLARTAPTGRHVERHDLAYVDDAGAVVTVGQAALEALGQTRPFFAALAVSADGRSAAATSPNAIVVLSADGELSRWENPSWSPRQVLHPEPGVVLLLDKEIMLGVRDANGWRSGKARKVSGAQVLRAHGRLLAVGTDAAQRLVLLGIGDGELIPLASFTERVAKPFFCDGRLYVSTPEGNGFEVVGVQSLLEEKLAAQARAKSKQKAKAKAKGEVSARPLEAVSIEVSALPELTWPPASAYGWAVENGYKGRVKTATFSRDGAVAWLCDGKALVEFNRTTHKSSVVCEDVAGKPIVQVAELDRDRLVCVTANKLATLRRKGDGFEVEQVVGTSKVTGLAAIPGRQAVATSTGREVTLFALPSGKKPKKVGTVTTRAFRLCGEGDRLYGMTYKVDEAWEVLGLDGPLPKT